MKLFASKPTTSTEMPPPDVSAAPRRYRGALTGAAISAVRLASQAAQQGKPMSERTLADRAATVDRFWRFLEAELRRQRLGDMATVKAVPGLNRGGARGA